MMGQEIPNEYCIFKAYHACTTLNRANAHLNEVRKYRIYKCVIPKGSKVFFDRDCDEIASDTIIIKRRLWLIGGNMDNVFNKLPKYILTNYKYENNHIGLCFFTLIIKKVWNNKWCACYINQSRGDNYCRYLQSYVDASEDKVKRKLFKWVQEHQNEFKLMI